MKVLLLNGSPRKNGCTYTALNVVADTLKAEGIDAEVFQAGDPDMENVKAAAVKLKESDALVVGSPVYWASPTGQVIEFMDRLASVAGKDMFYKPAAAVASARRAGTTAKTFVNTLPQKSRPGSSCKLHAGAAYYNDWSTLAQTSVLK